MFPYTDSGKAIESDKNEPRFISRKINIISFVFLLRLVARFLPRHNLIPISFPWRIAQGYDGCFIRSIPVLFIIIRDLD